MDPYSRGHEMRHVREVVLASMCVVNACGQPEDIGVAGHQSAHSTDSGLVIRTWSQIAWARPFGNPLRLARILAIMHVAQHDAVNSACPRYETYASTLEDSSADAEAAAAAAAHRVLTFFFPADQAVLDAELGHSLARVPDGPAEDAGVDLGAAVAQQVLDARENDGYETVDPFTPTPGPGIWEPTPPAFAPLLEPQYQNVAPFAIERRDQFRLLPPPSLRSARYTRDFEEVYLYGRDTSTVRSADQTHLAHFWREASPLGWSRIATVISEANEYDLHKTARLLALLNMGMSDGFVAGWYWKRFHAFWRPVTAIQKADTDGNRHTAKDESWLPLHPTPALPDHPSTHSLLGGVGAEILRRFTGSDHASFCMTSTTALPAGSTRCWNSYSEAELENADSRVMIGFHFRTACERGVQQGRRIGRYIHRHALEEL
jgi:PAP2 superfamily